VERLNNNENVTAFSHEFIIQKIQNKFFISLNAIASYFHKTCKRRQLQNNTCAFNKVFRNQSKIFVLLIRFSTQYNFRKVFMKKIIVAICLIIPIGLFAQFGLKGGLNFANVTSASSINSSSQSGFHAGIIFGPRSKKILSYRTELLYSKQGYNYATDSTTGNVKLDYIISTHLLCINITKFVQIQIGGQVAYLISAKADSASKTNNNAGPYPTPLDYYNLYDYGFGGGIEFHPVSGLLVGARYNISLSKLYKTTLTGQPPSFSSIDAKNNVVQISVGWLFGKDKSGKKK
jgi:hypothetical protein